MGDNSITLRICLRCAACAHAHGESWRARAFAHVDLAPDRSANVFFHGRVQACRPSAGPLWAVVLSSRSGCDRCDAGYRAARYVSSSLHPERRRFRCARIAASDRDVAPQFVGESRGGGGLIVTETGAGRALRYPLLIGTSGPDRQSAAAGQSAYMHSRISRPSVSHHHHAIARRASSTACQLSA